MGLTCSRKVRHRMARGCVHSGSNVWDISRKGSAALSSNEVAMSADQGSGQKPLRQLHCAAEHNSQAADAQYQQVDT